MWTISKIMASSIAVTTITRPLVDWFQHGKRWCAEINRSDDFKELEVGGIDAHDFQKCEA
jgi:hypothetical protein